MSKTETITATVDAIVSFLAGQETFLISPQDSLENCWNFLNCSIGSNIFFFALLFAVGPEESGRPGGIRTPIPRIWSPVL